MSNDLVSLLLDVVILVFLGVTIVFVYRLTKGLEDFKKHRQEFDSTIANLLASIDQADHSVRMLKKVSAQEATNLEMSVAQAKALSEELRIITDSGEGMAKRLEKLAEINRKIVQPNQGASFSRKKRGESYSARGSRDDASDKISSPVYREADQKKKAQSYDTTLKRFDKGSAENRHDMPSFMIKDQDSISSNDGADFEDIDEGIIVPKRPQSQAEKDLLDALRSTRKNISGK
jgi:hypothetical protein